MKLDLAAIAGHAVTRSGRVRAEWAGGAIEIDETEYISRVADAVATTMGQNLYKGLTPDGSATMPGRKLDGKPRGMASNIARALASRSIGVWTWLIAAHREIQGHMARIMREVPLRAPPLSTMGPAIRAAFKRVLKVGKEAGAKLTWGEQLMTGSRMNWSGGKRMKLGRLFGKDTTSTLESLSRLRLGRQIKGPRKRASGIARALKGPRKR